MWDDETALRLCANVLFTIAAAFMLYGTAHYVAHLPAFPLRAIELSGDVAHVTHEQVEAVVEKQLRGNFFTVDLERVRAAFETLPWVRVANVRRQWPDRLQVAVEEHKPFARWASTALVSAQGEVFEAAVNANLPVLKGPDGSAPEMVLRFQDFSRVLEPTGRRIVQMTLSNRRAWVLKLDDGAVLELGRADLETRLIRFVAAYERIVLQIPHPSTHIDLRYTNGFAVRSPGLKWDRNKT